MSGAEFGRALVDSFIATFVATIYGYWEVALGLTRIDFALILGQGVVPRGSPRELAYIFGLLQQFIGGMILGLIFVRLFQRILPGPYLIKGFIFGLIIWVGSGLIISPVHDAGLFWRRWGAFTIIGVFIWHIVWGSALGIGCRLARPKPPP